MLYLSAPNEFRSKFDSAGCFMEYDGKFLLLHRQDERIQGNKWGVPGGKAEPGESPIDTLEREIKEETGFEVDPEKLVYIGKFFVKYPGFDFIYYAFRTKLDFKPRIRRNKKEHKASKWVTPEKALSMDLILDEDACIKLAYGRDYWTGGSL